MKQKKEKKKEKKEKKKKEVKTKQSKVLIKLSLLRQHIKKSCLVWLYVSSFRHLRL